MVYQWHSLALFWEEDKAYLYNPHTLDELMQSIHEIVTYIEVSDLKLMSSSVFKRFEVCLRADRKHFEYLLWWLVFFIYFHKCVYMFLTCGILTITWDFLGRWWGGGVFRCTSQWQEGQVILLFVEDCTKILLINIFFFIGYCALFGASFDPVHGLTSWY